MEISPDYRPGLTGLDGFSHVLVIFGFHESPDCRKSDLVCKSPYLGGPESLGVFASRSPVRPNPLGVAVCSV